MPLRTHSPTLASIISTCRRRRNGCGRPSRMPAPRRRHEIKTMMRGASSRPDGPSRMKAVTSGKRSKAKAQTDWTRLRRLTASQIRKGVLSDAEVHPTDEKFCKKAKVVLPQRKAVITIRLDADLLDWFP